MKDLLIIGAGPYGLATAALAKSLQLDFAIVGMPMSLWREHVPNGLFLRTGKDEHFDVDGVHTMDAFFDTFNINADTVDPLPLSRYLEYADWFIAKKKLYIINDWVQKLTQHHDGGYLAELASGEEILAKKIIIAIGVADSKYIPVDLAALIPAGRYSHSSDHGDLSCFQDKSVLIIGGRQSAFETAVLLAEQDAKSVQVVCRHAIPSFTQCDFSFMHEIIAKVETDPLWYRHLSETKKQQWNEKAFTEGRLKLEHWLQPRLIAGHVKITGNANMRQLTSTMQNMQVLLDNGETTHCEHIIFATGFKPDISKVSFLQRGGLMDKIKIQTGSPVLDKDFQCSQQGLYFLGMFAMADFGFSFGFATGAMTAAKIILQTEAKQC